MDVDLSVYKTLIATAQRLASTTNVKILALESVVSTQNVEFSIMLPIASVSRDTPEMLIEPVRSLKLLQWLL